MVRIRKMINRATLPGIALAPGVVATLVCIYLYFGYAGNPYGYVYVWIITYALILSVIIGIVALTQGEIKEALLQVYVILGSLLGLYGMYKGFEWLIRQPWYPFK